MSWLTFLPDIISGSASIFGSIMGSSASSSNTSRTNEANLAIARETNETNQQIQRDTNAANIAMNTSNNQLQMQLQREMNEYNSIGSQLERGAKAGVNPNAILGGVSGNLQSSLPSVTAGHADMTPVQGVTLENPASEKLGFLSAITNLASTISQAKLNQSQTEKNNAETNQTITLSKWIDLEKQAGINLTRRQSEKVYQETLHTVELTKSTAQSVEQSKAQVALMNEQTKRAQIENLYKEENEKALLQILKTQAHYSDAMARYTLEKWRSEIGLNNSSSSLNYARKNLTEHEVRLCDANYELATTQNQQQIFNLGLDKEYSSKERYYRLNNDIQTGRNLYWSAEDKKFYNSAGQRDLRTGLQIVNGVCQFMNAGSNVISSFKPSINLGSPSQEVKTGNDKGFNQFNPNQSYGWNN